MKSVNPSEWGANNSKERRSRRVAGALFTRQKIAHILSNNAPGG
jgi:hypothetical protein